MSTMAVPWTILRGSEWKWREREKWRRTRQTREKEIMNRSIFVCVVFWSTRPNSFVPFQLSFRFLSFENRCVCPSRADFAHSAVRDRSLALIRSSNSVIEAVGEIAKRKVTPTHASIYIGDVWTTETDCECSMRNIQNPFGGSQFWLFRTPTTLIRRHYSVFRFEYPAVICAWAMLRVRTAYTVHTTVYSVCSDFFLSLNLQMCKYEPYVLLFC